MDARQRKRQKEKARKAERRQRGVVSPPTPTWPPVNTPDNYTDAERYGLAIHPASAGLGSCSRVMSDSDWVHGMIEKIEEYGITVVMRNMAVILILTEGAWNNPKERTDKPDPPITTYWGGFLPMATPLLAFTGRPADDCYVIAASPVYLGLAGFEAAVKFALWIRCVRRAAKLRGITQLLVDTLAVLRHAYGYPGHNARHLPSGYAEAERKVFYELARTQETESEEGGEET